jgi:hypothetical protein
MGEDPLMLKVKGESQMTNRIFLEVIYFSPVNAGSSLLGHLAFAG